MRTAIICQARTTSTRLPRKVLLPLAGKPLLLRCVERLQASRMADVVVVATTTDPSDDVIVELCASSGIDVYRGHPTDLLDRHLRAAQMVSADVIVKVPSDCPLIDPHVIDDVLRAFNGMREHVDFISNLHPPTWPDGNDVEVMTIELLERAAKLADRSYEREHTTPWMWDANRDVRTANVVRRDGQDYSATHRWTIDYPEDYVLIKAVYDALYTQARHFTCEEALEYLSAHPEVAGVNAHLRGINWYRHHLDSLQTIQNEQTRSFYNHAGGQV